MDDYSNDINTTGRLTVNGSVVSAMFETEGDADWFRVEVQAFRVYNFLPPNGNFITGTAVYDQTGERIQSLETSGHRFVAPYSGFVFFEATQPVPTLANYVARVTLPDDDYTNFFSRRDSRVLSVDGFSDLGGAIEIAGDVDIVKYTFNRGTSNVITLNGSDSSDATLENPNLRIYRKVGNSVVSTLELVAADNSSGPGRSAQISYNAGSRTEELYLMIDSIGGGVGTYQLVIDTVDDFPSNRTTNGRLNYVANHNTGPTRVGNLERFGDVDAFLLSAQAGQWYNITPLPNARPLLRVLDESDNLVNTPPTVSDPQSLTRQGVFYAETSGEYLISARGFEGVSGSGRLNGGIYQLTVDARFPFLTASDEIETFGNPLEIESDYTFDRYQLFSEVHFQRGLPNGPTTLVPPRRVIEVSADTEEQFSASNGLNQGADLWIRAHEPFTGRWTTWEKIEQTGRLRFVTREPNMLHFGTYAFADALPLHWQGDAAIDGFVPFTATERQAFRDALASWNIVDDQNPTQSLTEIDPGANNNAAEVMIFKSNISNELMVVPNTWNFDDSLGRSADLVIDSDSPVFNDLTPGGRGFFELVRGVGLTIGSRENDSPRNVSVMGQRFGNDIDHLPWPSSPLPNDLVDKKPYKPEQEFNPGPERYRIIPPNNGNDRYFFVQGQQSFSTVMDRTGIDWFSANGVDLSVTIDLRVNSQSFTGSGGNQRQTMMIAFDTQIENAVGGNSADNISGNHFDNLLIGNSGDDTLNGRRGYDRLYGGAGNDRYVFEIGDETNIINEQGAGGFDRLQLVGFDSFDEVEDLTFQRLGNDLLVRLRLDGNDGHIADLIRIRNMGDSASRVEQLRLDNIQGENLFGMSLVSAFDQSTRTPQRFELAGGNDAFGPLVQPI